MESLKRGDSDMKYTSDVDFCLIDREIEERAEFLASEITTVSQLVELQAQRETFEFGRREDQKEEDILSQAFHLATKRMSLI